jgi:hypothetical protein
LTHSASFHFKTHLIPVVSILVYFKDWTGS